MQPTALTYQEIHRHNEWADVLELFDDGVFVAEGERPSSARKKAPVFLVNPNYEQTGEEPRLTDGALKRSCAWKSKLSRRPADKRGIPHQRKTARCVTVLAA